MWPSAGKQPTSWLSAYAGLLHIVLIVCVPFPFGVWGGMWNSIVTVPDICLFSYFVNLMKWDNLQSTYTTMAEFHFSHKT